jgi:DNA-directed RNA polymerase specialized sigma24 family protein
MDRLPDDPAAADDLTLVQAARSGDRLAFGVLYLRHHAAAWRVACVASRFSPDAELALIEGFTRVFSALPADSEEFEAAGVAFRPYLLACVRQAALSRARAAGREEPGSTRHPSGKSPASPPSPAPLAGLAPDGEVVLSTMEHHVARGALAALPERTRLALWLSDVEAMTPVEVAGILGTDREGAATLVAEARAEVRAAQANANGRHEVRADCRFTVEHLSAYHAGTLDPKKGVLVRSHLDICPPCRMRLGELANGPATLAAAVPAAPLLGGEAQHHWLSSASEVRPADRLLPPGLAAANPTWHLPAALRPARDHRKRRVAGVARGAPVAARGVGRRVRRARSAVPAVTLVIAWLGVMLSLPQLMQPSTVPGPGGLALPAVQAYVPDFLPGAGKSGAGDAKGSKPAQPGPTADAGGGSELAAQLTSEANRSGAGGSGSSDAAPTVGLISTSTSRVRPSGPTAGAATPAPALTVTLPAMVTNVVPIAPLEVAPPSLAPAPTPPPPPAVVPELEPKNGPKPAVKDAKELRKEIRQSVQEAKQEAKEARQAAKEARKATRESKKAERRTRPVSRGRVVTA